MYQSIKVFDGFSTVYRQWGALGSHCKYLHGYALSFRVTFEGALDTKHWVFDFGGLKRATTTINGLNPKDWLNHMFDHTVIIAEDDPERFRFEDLSSNGLIQLRVIEKVGAEAFAQFLHEKLNEFVRKETGNRVGVKKVEVMENNKNSASYEA